MNLANLGWFSCSCGYSPFQFGGMDSPCASCGNRSKSSFTVLEEPVFLSQFPDWFKMFETLCCVHLLQCNVDGVIMEKVASIIPDRVEEARHWIPNHEMWQNLPIPAEVRLTLFYPDFRFCGVLYGESVNEDLLDLWIQDPLRAAVSETFVGVGFLVAGLTVDSLIYTPGYSFKSGVLYDRYTKQLLRISHALQIQVTS